MSEYQGNYGDAQFEQDVKENKTMAILAYFIFFLPLIAAKESRFARYHANQGLILLIAYVALGIVNSILNTILFAAFFTGGFGILTILGLIFTVAYLGLAALGILGIVNAAKGKMSPMPLIGGFTIIR